MLILYTFMFCDVVDRGEKKNVVCVCKEKVDFLHV